VSGCVWLSYSLPHTSHEGCAGFMPDLAEGLANLMDHAAARPADPDRGGAS
jgi:hypothetical protein